MKELKFYTFTERVPKNKERIMVSRVRFPSVTSLSSSDCSGLREARVEFPGIDNPKKYLDTYFEVAEREPNKDDVYCIEKEFNDILFRMLEL